MRDVEEEEEDDDCVVLVVVVVDDDDDGCGAVGAAVAVSVLLIPNILS